MFMQYKFFGNPLVHFFGTIICGMAVAGAGSAVLWGPEAFILVLSITTTLIPLFMICMTMTEQLWYFRFRAFFNKNYKVVQLLDYTGNLSYALALKQKHSDKLTTFIYHRTRVGPLVLHENGLVTEPDHDETYVMFWQPNNRQDLMMWLLKDPICDFGKVQDTMGGSTAFAYLRDCYQQAPKPWLNYD